MTPPDGPAVRVQDLRKSFRFRRREVAALRGASFEIAPGEVLALLGPNGAGKTTVIDILAGFTRADGGRVEVLGTDPRRGGRALRERIGCVLQETATERYLTVREVLTRNAGYYPRPRPVGEVLELVGLVEKAEARVKTLSGGQQRRLDVGLGIIGDPELLFLDEPTTGFDPSARRTAWELVERLKASGTTILLTTHYLEEAQQLADKVAVLVAGRVVAAGTPADLGGQARGVTSIRFRLPEGVERTRLPVVAAAHGNLLEVHAEDDMRTLHTLTSWALETRTRLEELTVTRPTLEDAYLRLLASAGEDA